MRSAAKWSHVHQHDFRTLGASRSHRYSPYVPMVDVPPPIPENVMHTPQRNAEYLPFHSMRREGPAVASTKALLPCCLPCPFLGFRHCDVPRLQNANSRTESHDLCMCAQNTARQAPCNPHHEDYPCAALGSQTRERYARQMTLETQLLFTATVEGG